MITDKQNKMADINNSHSGNTTNNFNYTITSLANRSIVENAICATVLLIILTESVIGNIVVIFSVFRFSNLCGEISNMFIVNLSITDLCTSLIVMMSSMVIFISDYWPLGTFWCNLVCAANYCLIIVSMLTLCFISIDRYIAIKHPLKYMHIVTRKKVLMMICFAWFQGIMFAIIPVIFHWVEFDYWEVICAISWYKERQQALFYVIFAFILCFLLPGLLLGYCYWCVLCVAHKQSRQISHVYSSPNMSEQHKYSTSNKAMRSLLIVVVGYFLCMTPFSCTKLYKVSVNEDQSLPNYVNLVASMLAFCSSAVNPLIYGIFRKDFRTAYKLLWRQIMARNSIDITVSTPDPEKSFS